MSCDALLVHLRGKLADIEGLLVAATARRDEIRALIAQAEGSRKAAA